MNSTIVLEGVARFLKTLKAEELEACAIGSYDGAPFASMLSSPIQMVRQNVPGLVTEAFRLIDSGKLTAGKVIEIHPELVTVT